MTEVSLTAEMVCVCVWRGGSLERLLLHLSHAQVTEGGSGVACKHRGDRCVRWVRLEMAHELDSCNSKWKEMDPCTKWKIAPVCAPKISCVLLIMKQESLKKSIPSITHGLFKII